MQVPSHVEYERPGTVEEALTLLAGGSGDARPLAGGHSLIPMMKLRLARPELLVDINGLTELSYIRQTGDEITIGALTRHAELLESALVYEHYPIFRDAERVIADPVVRNWGTVGGSLCQADPSEDLSAAFAAARATAVIRSQQGSRTVTARELHVGPYETVLEPGELLTEVRLPVRARTGSAYEKVERRVGDWSIVAVGAVLTLNAGGTAVETAGIGLTAVGAPQFAAPEAEEYLAGKPATEENFAAAARIAAASSNPVSDQRGPEDYKRHLVAELTTRALRTAARRARGEA
ncbi:MAG TPA: xanthine dehydrogenase family protein subunit M [Trebonia sp.]|jgi:carbon-monoxide dehydrogenase medium subunit|nr:xanthine dehydrogenase family protein subunit M [Trebonia sp.]